ncbi:MULTISPECIES: helicase associated domain-containing protein [unclassified Streptomyces]|uniref:helicase associated domain-containing protein n=1 Tax=unclassified Streptomyces TaxID=2593676 RepID=UPI002E0FEBAD|nr:helicase associated domain-containing protein [Streptomyces sp. NBC_01205]
MLRFAAPRDPALIAKWISYQIFNTERQDWRRGVEAAWRYREREGGPEVPYDHTEGAYPLGRWLSDQRRAFRAGTMTGEREGGLEGLGIVWDIADAGFETNLAAARAYYELHGTLAAPRHATALDRSLGQWLTSIRRLGGLGKDPERARRRADALASIDEDWNPSALGWTVDWQRHHAYLRYALAAGARLGDIVPGVTLARRRHRPLAHHPEAGTEPAERGAAPAARRTRREGGEGRTSPHGGDDGAAFGVVVGPPGGVRSEEGHDSVRRDPSRERGGPVRLHRFEGGADLGDGGRGVVGHEALPGFVRRYRGQQRADPGRQLWKVGF